MQPVGVSFYSPEVLHLNVGATHENRPDLRAELSTALNQTDVGDAAIVRGKTFKTKRVAHAPAARFFYPFHCRVDDEDIRAGPAEEDAVPVVSFIILRV